MRRNQVATDEMVLDYIRLYLGRQGFVPTVREIARGVGLTSTSAVQHHLTNLERDGRIRRVANSARAIVVVAA